MTRSDQYTQIELLKALYFGCPDAAAWDKNEADYVHALEEMRAKEHWLREVNKPYKGRWHK